MAKYITALWAVQENWDIYRFVKMADLAVVGKFGRDGALASVGATTSAANLFLNFLKSGHCFISFEIILVPILQADIGNGNKRNKEGKNSICFNKS